MPKTRLLLLHGDTPQDGSGNTGIAFVSGADHNQVRNNYFLGLNGVAAAVRGTHNTFGYNFIGTRFDGQVTEKQADPSLVCTPVDYSAGGQPGCGNIGIHY